VIVVDDVRDQLRRASAKYLKTGQEHDATQEALVAVVVAALRQGLTPTEVVELSPYSPAYVRKIARQHEIPAAPLGRKPRTNLNVRSSPATALPRDLALGEGDHDGGHQGI
jgi:hypothetical protein